VVDAINNPFFGQGHLMLLLVLGSFGQNTMWVKILQ
jgi:hypothetical protein